MILSQLFEFHAQHGEPLVDVVVKLSPDPSAFLLLRFDQLPGHCRQCVFCLLAARHVQNLGNEILPRTIPAPNHRCTTLGEDDASTLVETTFLNPSEAAPFYECLTQFL